MTQISFSLNLIKLQYFFFFNFTEFRNFGATKKIKKCKKIFYAASIFEQILIFIPFICQQSAIRQSAEEVALSNMYHGNKGI